MTMNEADADTRDSYHRYMLEVLQLEYERSQEMRDIVQAQNVCDEHTSPNATQVAADDIIMHDVGGVKGVEVDDDDGYDAHDADLDWDEWLDDLWSAEELERAQREQDEVRDDH